MVQVKKLAELNTVQLKSVNANLGHFCLLEQKVDNLQDDLLMDNIWTKPVNGSVFVVKLNLLSLKSHTANFNK